MVRQNLSKTADAHIPSSGFCKCIFILCANAEFSNVLAPAFTGSAALVTKSAYIITLVAKHVPIAGYVNSIRTTTIDVFVFVTFYPATGANTQVMIHQVMTQFSAAASQSIRPNVSGRIHQDPCTVDS